MTRETVDAIVDKVREHVVSCPTPEFLFVFHGGEPLLQNDEFFAYFVQSARVQLEKHTRPVFSLQTNGLLLTLERANTLSRLGIGIGISLDGTKEVNDANRVDFQGRGTHDRVVHNLMKVSHSGSTFAPPGILAVIDVNSDPVQTYMHFKKIGMHCVDFLLPEANFDKIPACKVEKIDDTSHADWLIRIFDTWFYEQPKTMEIRLFEMIIERILGSTTNMDSLPGSGQNEVVAIETDGGIEPVAALRICGNGFTKMGLNVQVNALADLSGTELGQIFLSGGSALSETCISCSIRELCGGGYLPHRYSTARGFNNASVYCADLKKLITHIHDAVLCQAPKLSEHLSRVSFDA